MAISFKLPEFWRGLPRRGFAPPRNDAEKLIDQRQCECKFRLALPAGNGDIFSVGAYDGFDDVQSQSPAVPVLGPGFVGLVEPVEDQRQFLGRNGLALIGYGNIDLAAALPDLQTQLGALGAEFHRVVDQIVDHLGDGILVGPGVGGVFGDVHVHVQALVVDLLFKADLTKAEIGSIKKLAVDLLAKVKAKIAELDHWADKPETKAIVDNLIRDTLWAELPECYDEMSISAYRQEIYQYVYMHYKDVA